MNSTYKNKKRRNSNKYILLFLLSFCILSTSCKKFLEQKPRISDVVPQSLNDLQTLLDNSAVVNGSSASAFSELISDNYYVTTANWQQLTAIGTKDILWQTQNYIWATDAVPTTVFWRVPYGGPIYYSNIVLDQLSLVKKASGEETKSNNIKGSALFYRAFNYHVLAQLFCKPYSQDNAGSPGLVLRLTSNVSENISNRASIQQLYDRIIQDLKEAATLLPQSTLYLSRPTQAAAYAELARVYLSMRDYTNASNYAGLALQQKNGLLDYNSLIPVASPAIPANNLEVIFNNYTPSANLLLRTRAKIDSALYRLYDVNDLRKSVFFGANSGANAGTYFFKGSYGSNYDQYGVFDGLATDELYLIRAECSARAGNKDVALADLNTLMSKRWNKGVTYVNITATDANDALNKILAERRKELLWRGLRWSDIRRLNLEGANITLKRVIAGTEYTLPPNDLRSVMLIPVEEIDRSGIQQNPR